MNKKYIFLGMILIWGLVVFGLSACKHSEASMASNPTAQIEKQSANYHVMVTIANPPLKSQMETYTLTVHDRKAGKPLEQIPIVNVEMPGMKAPTTVSKENNPGEFEVKTEFTMGGDWTLHVKPTPTSEAITLTLPIQ